LKSSQPYCRGCGATDQVRTRGCGAKQARLIHNSRCDPIYTSGETNPMAEHVDGGECSANLFDAQDGGEGFDPLGLEETHGGPVPLEGVLIEEFDAAQGDGAGHPGPSGDIGAIEEILPQFLIGDQVWGFMVVFGEFADGPGVGLLGSG
jgi:hypothetical protein